MNCSGFDKGTSAKRERVKNLTHHTSPAFSHWLPYCIFCFTHRSADLRKARASSYFHYRNIVAILLLFSFQHVVLNALCTVSSKSPALALAFLSSYIYLWHSPTLYHIICAFLVVWYPPLHPPPGFPFTTFFPDLILTFFISCLLLCLSRTPWFIGDHNLLALADKFPSGHRWRFWWCLQLACPSSGQQDNVAVQQGETVLTKKLWGISLCAHI